MSEYQYYEFQSIDRHLTSAQQSKLRDLSTRARISATSFVNHYEWGDFKGSPTRLMETVFDLHLYLANWGTRRFSMRLPRRLVDVAAIEACCVDDEVASVRAAGENIVIDFERDEEGYELWDDGSGRLAALAPLRADILNGDLRVCYLAWLMAVEADIVADDAVEPPITLPPLTGALEAFADFFAINGDLIEAATANNAAPKVDPDGERAHALIRTLPDKEKTAVLIDLFEGKDPHLAVGFRRRIRRQLETPAGEQRRRTAGDLRAAAQKALQRRKKREAARAEVERRRKEAQAAEERRRRLDAIRRRGEAVWADVEAAIQMRNRPGYEQAAALLSDLQVVAQEAGETGPFKRRLGDIRGQHARKQVFIETLDAAGL